QVGWLPSDGVPLGIIAIQGGLPAWFDPALLRHALRLPGAPDVWQQDLWAHYRQLFNEIAQGLAGQTAAPASASIPAFRATDYFSLLPPTGLVPKANVDPQSGTQTFFPEQIDVVLAPVRADELEVLTAEAIGEAPVDLAAGDPAYLIVLAPLQPAQFGGLA